jgi:glutamine amidotransferase
MEYRGKFPFFPYDKISTYPISQRKNKVTQESLYWPDKVMDMEPEYDHPDLETIADAIITAMDKGHPVIWLMGAHPVKAGMSPLITGLMQRGGRTGPHRDGWGIAFYEGRGCRLFHDPEASADSEIARLVQRLPIKSRTVLSHIRLANRGRVCLENTHPFVRELWGQPWTFAHNGQLRGIKRRRLVRYAPVGTTDSEHAFCWLLDRVRRRFGSSRPPDGQLRAALARWCRELARLGVFNVLFSDSRCLYAFGSTTLHWLTRRSPFGPAHLVDADMTVDFSEVTTPNDVVTVVASHPLTDNETWQVIAPGSFLAFRLGEVVFEDAREGIP